MNSPQSHTKTPCNNEPVLDNNMCIVHMLETMININGIQNNLVKKQNPWHQFCRHHRESVKKQFPDKNVHAVNKELSKMWAIHKADQEQNNTTQTDPPKENYHDENDEVLRIQHERARKRKTSISSNPSPLEIDLIKSIDDILHEPSPIDLDISNLHPMETRDEPNR